MLHVLVQLDGAVLLVAAALVERGRAALGVQVHLRGPGFARKALGLGQQRRAEAAAARLGQHGQAAEHPTAGLVGVLGVGERASAARERALGVVEGHVEGGRVLVEAVELVRKALLLHEHARAHDARVREVSLLEPVFHGVSFP